MKPRCVGAGPTRPRVQGSKVVWFRFFRTFTLVGGRVVTAMRISLPRDGSASAMHMQRKRVADVVSRKSAINERFAAVRSVWRAFGVGSKGLLYSWNLGLPLLHWAFSTQCAEIERHHFLGLVRLCPAEDTFGREHASGRRETMAYP